MFGVVSGWSLGDGEEGGESPPPTLGTKTKSNKALLTPVNSVKVKRKLSPDVRPSLPPSSLLPFYLILSRDRETVIRAHLRRGD